jgi:uncharacterized membrane protein YraQ (UPF0718 family)
VQTLKTALDTVNERGRAGYLIVTPLVIAAMLFVYKTRASLRVLRATWASGTIAARPEVVSFTQISAIGILERSWNYFLVIWPALVYGILIAAAVRAFVSPKWLARVLHEKSLKTQVTAGLAGAPLMLCSCCIAPVFTSVAQSSSRLGPALGLMVASPALNPAALTLTFLLFSPGIASMRLAVSLLAVLAIGPVVEQMFPRVALRPPKNEDTVENTAHPVARFLGSIGTVALRTIPGLVIGVVLSMLIVQSLPAGLFDTLGNRLAALLITATIAVPLALPTFLEIPLALSLLAAGFPPGAAVALLFAGPSINLPSLWSVARVSGAKVAVAVAALIWILAVTAGLLIS